MFFNLQKAIRNLLLPKMPSYFGTNSILGGGGGGISTNLALGFHWEDSDGALEFYEESGKTASVSHSARVYNPSNGYTLKAQFDFSNSTQLDDSTNRHTFGTFTGTSPASGQDYIFLDSTSSEYGEFDVDDDYQGDFDKNDDFKITFDVAVCNSPTSGTFIHLRNNEGAITGTVIVGYSVTSGTWKLRITYGGSTVTGTYGHTCETGTSPPYTNFYTLTLVVSGNTATLSSAHDSVAATVPSNVWVHHITTHGPRIGATQNSTVPSYSTYGRFALKNFKHYLRDQFPSSIPSNGGFDKYALFTGGDLLKYDGHADFTLDSSSDFTIGFRFLIPSGPSNANSDSIFFYIGDITSNTTADRAYVKLTVSSSTINFFGTNTAAGSGGSFSFSRNTWYTFLLARDGTNNHTRIYINGTQVGSTATNYIDLATPPVYLGGGRDGAGTLITYKGFFLMDDFYFRLTCEQTGSSYSVPTTPFPLN